MSDNKEAWHLDKKVSISHIFTTIAFLGAGLSYAHKLDTQLAVQSTQIKTLESKVRENDQETSKRIEQLTAAIERRLGRIDGKLDKLIIERHK